MKLFSNKIKLTERAGYIAVALLLVLLLSLTYALIYLRNVSNKSDIPFELDMITADRSETEADISAYLTPAFIGITSAGERYGIMGYENTVNEIYSSFFGVISDALSSPRTRSVTEAEWMEYADGRDSVYVRYHRPLADSIILLFADPAEWQRNSSCHYVYEMFIIPRGDEGRTILAVRDTDGAMYLYETDGISPPLTSGELSDTVRSYSSVMRPFMFADEEYMTASPTEPVMLESMYTKNVIITGYTSQLIQNSESELDSLMRLFGINPDKLLNKHISDTGTGSFIDTHGLLHVAGDRFIYTATDVGGVALADIIGYRDSYSVREYAAAAISVYERIRAISEYYIGGAASVSLTAAYSDGDSFVLELSYFVDNYRISGIPPAMTLRFSDELLVEAEIYTVAARGLGVRDESVTEWWFLDKINGEGIIPVNTTLVYEGDFVSESISAVWTAEIEK